MHLISVDVGVGAKVIKVYLCYDIIIFSFNHRGIHFVVFCFVV